MSSELKEMRREHADHQLASQAFSVTQESLQTLLQDIKTMIALLDEETSSPQVMNEWVKRFVSNVCVERETRVVHIKVQNQNEERKMFEKTIVTEW